MTKLDGTNLTVAWYDEPIGLVVASRNNVVYRNGALVEFPTDKEGVTEQRFVDAVDYVRVHDGIQTLVSMGYVLRGEWMVQHSIVYDKQVYGNFYVFDVQRHDGSYVHPDNWIPLATENLVRYIPVTARLLNPTVEQLVELTKGPDEFGAQQKEGIVLKRYDFSNKWGRTTWGKLVSAEFKEKMHAAMGATNEDPPEVRFAARVVTYALIMKTIKNMEGVLRRKLVIHDMPQVLRWVWRDAFSEELWDFVKRENVGKFDFKSAHKIAERKTRDVALAYFNNVPIVWEH